MPPPKPRQFAASSLDPNPSALSCVFAVVARYNFNHERFVLGAMSNRYARVCLEEAIKYAQTRKTFGKALVEHQVIIEDCFLVCSLF